MELADELGYHIALNSSLVAGTNLFGNFLPDSPDRAVIITEYGGGPPTRVLANSTARTTAWENPRVQVVARAADPAASKTLSRKVWKILEVIQNQTVGGSSGSYYLRVETLQSPFLLKRDQLDRVYFCFNVDVARTV